jgi:cysteinyl-tRNA synthetase
MAKRLGNVTTVQGMREARIPAAAVRHFVFNTHYRKELNLSEEALEASINAVQRVGDFADRLGAAAAGHPSSPRLPMSAGRSRVRARRRPERAERAGGLVHLHS